MITCDFAAKLGLLSLAKTMAVEGAKYNIKCNTIVPVAASRMTEELFPEELKEKFNPKYVAPMVAFLSHESCPVSGEAFEAAAGFYGQYRWQRSKGKVFAQPDAVTPEDISSSWDALTDMSEASSPSSMQGDQCPLISGLPVPILPLLTLTITSTHYYRSHDDSTWTAELR